MQRNQTLAVILVAIVCASTAGAASTNLYWQGPVAATSDWETAANWDKNVVPSIANESQCWVINGGTARITQPGQSGQYLLLGYGLGESGHVRLQAGTFATSGYEQIAKEGTATFTQMNATTNTVGDTLTVAEGNTSAPRGTGTYYLNGGLLQVAAGDVNLGYYAGATGRLTQTSGTFGPLANNRYLYLGRGSATVPGGFGSYTITGGAMLFTNGNYVSIGEYGTGELRQSNATVTVDQYVTVGRRSIGRGTYALDGGEASIGTLVLGETSGATGLVGITRGHLHLGSQTAIGQSGYGAFNQSGGTVTMANVNYVWLGRFAGAEGKYVLSGAGALLLTNANNYLSVGESGAGTFEQSNGTVNVKNYVIAGHNSGSTGRYTIRGGSLTAGGNLDVGQAAGATGTLQVVGSSCTISVGGNYDQNAVSTLSVLIDAGGLSPINVSGNVSLNGTLEISGRGLDYNQVFTVINAGPGKLSGNFSRTNLVSSLSRADVIYDNVNGDVKVTHFQYPGTVISIR